MCIEGVRGRRSQNTPPREVLTKGAHHALCKKLAILDLCCLMAKVTAVTTVYPHTGLPRFLTLLSPKTQITMFHAENARLLSNLLFCPVDVASPMVGGFLGGHRNANLLLGAVPPLCRNAPQGEGPNPATRIFWRLCCQIRNDRRFLMRAESADPCWCLSPLHGSFTHSGPIQIRVSTHAQIQDGTGCTSSVGRQGGAQTVGLQVTCSFGDAVNQLGHVLGLYGEHQRWDRDTWITVTSVCPRHPTALAWSRLPLPHPVAPSSHPCAFF